MRLIDADVLIQYWITPPANIGWDDEIEAVNNQPTVEAILKVDYESRLKADLVAILDRVRAEIEELDNITIMIIFRSIIAQCTSVMKCCRLSTSTRKVRVNE